MFLWYVQENILRLAGWRTSVLPVHILWRHYILFNASKYLSSEFVSIDQSRIVVTLYKYLPFFSRASFSVRFIWVHFCSWTESGLPFFAFFDHRNYSDFYPSGVKIYLQIFLSKLLSGRGFRFDLLQTFPNSKFCVWNQPKSSRMNLSRVRYPRCKLVKKNFPGFRLKCTHCPTNAFAIFAMFAMCKIQKKIEREWEQVFNFCFCTERLTRSHSLLKLCNS